MFSFKVGSSELRVSSDDASRVRWLSTKSGLRSVRPEAVAALAQPGGWLDRDQWMAQTSRILSELGSGSNEEVEEFASELFQGVRLGFSARSADLAIGLSLLTGARKSEKLASSYDCYGGKQLEVKDVTKLLRATLTAIWSAASSSSAPQPGSIEEEAESLAHRIGATSFDDFGAWYNSQGFEMAAWLELLDLEKWPAPTDKYAIAFEFGSVDDEEGGDCLVAAKFSNLAVARVRAVAVGSGLFECEASALCDHVLRCASTSSQRLDRPAFDRALELACEDADDRHEVFSLLFDVFRRARDDAPADEIAAGLSIFCAGSKSAKLAVAWDIVAARPNAVLSRYALHRYLRSFLVVLLALATDHLQPPTHHFFASADSAAVTITADVFAQTKRQTHIAFDDFADWYTQGGFQLASWLELLDLNKWVL